MGEKTKTSSKYIYFTLIIILISITVKVFIDHNHQNELKRVIDGIIQLEKNADVNKFSSRSPRISIGFGGCTDYLVRAIKIFNHLNVTAPTTVNNRNIHEIYNTEDLTHLFSQFFVEGAAAERYIHNEDLFKKIVKFIKSDNESSHFAGGNAVVMANRMAQEGGNIILGSQLSEDQSKFLHDNVTTVTRPTNDVEDIHILMEYDINEEWGRLKAKRANRFIIHRDVNTPYMRGLQEMSDKMREFQPDLFVLGGLQMMDDFPYELNEKSEQITKIEKFLVESVSPELPVHFEMASFNDKNLMLMLKKQIIPYCDSLGFNEQELPNLLSVLEKDEITTMSTAYPRTSLTLDQMRSVWELLVDKKMQKNHKQLSRLHLHTISYQIIMTDTRSPYWHSSKSAAAKASLVAHRHTCGRHNIDVHRSKLFMDDSFAITNRFSNSPRTHFNISDPVSCWQEREVEVCIAPVLVCTKVKRTAGGGDNISSAALIAQLKINQQ